MKNAQYEQAGVDLLNTAKVDRVSRKKSSDNDLKAVCLSAANWAWKKPVSVGFSTSRQCDQPGYTGCGVDACYLCHTRGKPGRKYIFKSGFATYCLSCFLLNYVPRLLKEKVCDFKKKFFASWNNTIRNLMVYD